MRTVASVAALGLLAASACAPAQPAVLVQCASISDCPLGQVCDASQRQCIPEPENRFLGAFQCTLGQGTSVLGGSEVVGHIAGDRWSLPETFCDATSDGSSIVVGFASALGADHLTVVLDAALAAKGHVTLGPAFDSGLNSAAMINDDTSTAYGYSASGVVIFSPALASGITSSAYLDVTMYPVAQGDALFGASCPHGLADCGVKTSQAGGVATCTTVQSGPVCTRTCNGSGDCSVGNGVCVKSSPVNPSLCTKACTRDADCTPLRCVPDSSGQGSGCF